MKIVSYGTSTTGSTFEDMHPTFEDSVLVPFQKWLRKGFPKDVRLARSLPVAAPAPQDLQSSAPLFPVERDVDENAEDSPRPRRKAKRVHKKKRVTVAPVPAPAPTTTSQNGTVPVPAPTFPPQDASSDAVVRNEGVSETDATLPAVSVTHRVASMSDDLLALTTRMPTTRNSLAGTTTTTGAPPTSAWMAGAVDPKGRPQARGQPRLMRRRSVGPFTFTPPTQPERPAPRPIFKGSAFGPAATTPNPFGMLSSFSFAVPARSPLATSPSSPAAPRLTQVSASSAAPTSNTDLRPTEAARITLAALAVAAVMPEAPDLNRTPAVAPIVPTVDVASASSNDAEDDVDNELDIPLTRPMTKPPKKTTTSAHVGGPRGGARGGRGGARGGGCGGGRGGRSVTSIAVGSRQQTTTTSGANATDASSTTPTPAALVTATPAVAVATPAVEPVLIHSITPLHPGLQAIHCKRFAEKKAREEAAAAEAVAEAERQQQALDVARGFSLRNNPDGANPIISFFNKPDAKPAAAQPPKVLTTKRKRAAKEIHTRGELLLKARPVEEAEGSSASQKRRKTGAA
ncbi:hypothetical protein B0H16DRAFT_1453234 [Mycena metata]|uniref:Uncharacterized protein n=1 Tax=Mycena metata TaxID=1033252 RepID=A0AAD7NNE9_9AGAR|nr:hypothetical protein B0H16DRAFT_1453234 [Mycena metata]